MKTFSLHSLLMSVRELARKVGVSPTFISGLKKGTKHADLPKAVDIEIATGGEVKVEDIVRPEVAESLQKFLRLRCPMLKKIAQGQEGKSVEDEGEFTVEVGK